MIGQHVRNHREGAQKNQRGSQHEGGPDEKTTPAEGIAAGAGAFPRGAPLGSGRRETAPARWIVMRPIALSRLYAAD